MTHSHKAVELMKMNNYHLENPGEKCIITFLFGQKESEIAADLGGLVILYLRCHQAHQHLGERVGIEWLALTSCFFTNPASIQSHGLSLNDFVDFMPYREDSTSAFPYRCCHLFHKSSCPCHLVNRPFLPIFSSNLCSEAMLVNMKINIRYEALQKK